MNLNQSFTMEDYIFSITPHAEKEKVQSIFKRFNSDNRVTPYSELLNPYCHIEQKEKHFRFKVCYSYLTKNHNTVA